MSNAQSELGMNRTGVATAPLLTKAMLAGTEQLTPDGTGDEREIGRARGDCAREAEPLGSVPPPLTPKGMLKSAGQMAKGRDPVVFVDKLGERLAFERTGSGCTRPSSPSSMRSVAMRVVPHALSSRRSWPTSSSTSGCCRRRSKCWEPIPPS
jgi:hypothetical protein